MKFSEMDLIRTTNNIIFIYFIFNLITFFAYGIDKRKAIKNKWRIPEKTLIFLGAFGALGQIFGMKVFHHKTHKWYFVLSGWLFLIIQIIIFYIIYTKFYINL